MCIKKAVAEGQTEHTNSQLVRMKKVEAKGQTDQLNRDKHGERRAEVRSGQELNSRSRKKTMNGFAVAMSLVLMDCEEKEELRDLVQGAADWLGQWFIDIQPWTPIAVAKERFVWLRCQGAPLHAWGFLISMQIMNTISVMRRIKVNGVMYDLKFTEEELVNSLFSTRHDFKPNFSTDSEYEESWTDCNDLELNHEENDWGVDLEQLTGDGEEEGENRDFSQFDKWSSANPRNEVEFEFEEEKGDVKGHKLVDSFPSSWLGEEQSVEVVADSFDRSTEASELEGRVEAGLFENSPQNELSTNPIESSAGNNLGLQHKPNLEATCQAHDNEQQVGGQIWANQTNDTTKGMENESRIEQESVPQQKNRSAVKEKKAWREDILKFQPGMNNEVAGGSVVDSGIQNRNRLLKEHPSRRIAEELWDFARKIGVVAENEEQIINKLDEMEVRDRRANEADCSKDSKKKQKHIDWGPKPFKFFNAWFQQEGCMELVKEVWGLANIQGWVGFQLKEKLKLTKEALKRWSKTLLPVIDAKINKTTTEIAQIDKKGEEKSRKAWLNLGDANTSFFHKCIKGRWRRNEMTSIQIKGTQILCASRMMEEIASFFEDIFKEEQWDKPKLEGVSFKQISQLENDHLVGAFSEEEIDAAVRECDSSKAPGPDGFNFVFVKNVWELIRVDVIKFLHEFHKNGKLVRGLNTSFIVLVLKVDNPQKIEEYRPISLIGVMYKILAKLLANRLKVVLDGIVGEQQMAFIRGRQLMDGVVVANEVIDDVKKKRKETFLFKIDFEKAYDKKGLLDGVEVGSRGFKVSHLQYVDDKILFAKAKEENVWAMKGVLRAFELVSGLKINFNKSHLIGIHVQESWLNKMSWVLCCKVGVFPFKYLGIPIGGSSRNKAFWKPLVELLSTKLSTWKGRYLSLGGRITLINLVLSSLPVFWMSMYLIPKGTILSLDKIRIGFLWGGAVGEKKINWVKWEQVCKGKKQGGLGVKDLRKFNIALLGKWWGRIVMADKGLWKKVIAEKYGRVREPSFNWLRENMNFGSSWWRDLSRLNDIDKEKKGWLVDGLELKLGEGVDIRKDYKISQMGGWHNDIWKWSLQWRRSLFSWEEHQELELKEINEKTIARGRPDQRIWIHSKDGSYTTKSAYQILAVEHRNSQQGLALQKVWNPLIPSKISAFSWQLLQGKIPTKDNLMKRGVIKDPGKCRCELCGAGEENSSHLFVQCKVARDL
ncbi:hypothetical protein SLEP1_g45072 [Rubroshorea leprosula]|uniref:Reverse transcriptase domain-containing protein n=1 Tax=Rubroshorea leprosula TaxID=152421 RepID=A0AAV5LI03_9ROSI|nr:hypothetical protein SLEP1_g45072 [Rubroshorea leprosula]